MQSDAFRLRDGLLAADRDLIAGHFGVAAAGSQRCNGIGGQRGAFGERCIPRDVMEDHQDWREAY